jgi:hypothetical protein
MVLRHYDWGSRLIVIIGVELAAKWAGLHVTTKGIADCPNSCLNPSNWLFQASESEGE